MILTYIVGESKRMFTEKNIKLPIWIIIYISISMSSKVYCEYVFSECNFWNIIAMLIGLDYGKEYDTNIKNRNMEVPRSSQFRGSTTSCGINSNQSCKCNK